MNAAARAVEDFCRSRIPEALHDQIRLEVSRRGRSITIHEQRPPWEPDRMPSEWTSIAVAQLRYDPSSQTWTLYSSDASGRWSPYEGVGPTATVEPLLTEIDRDRTGIFWG